MKNKVKFIFVLLITLSFGACTNLKSTFTPNNYTPLEKSKFKVQEETEFYSVGHVTLKESGIAVAQMKAKEQAKSDLRSQIFNESTLVLKSFLKDTNSNNINISTNTISDLAKLVSSELISKAKQTNAWNEDNQEFIVLAIDKSLIPSKSKEIYTNHLKDIISDLNNSIVKISSDYEKTTTTPVVAKTSSVKTGPVSQESAPVDKDSTSEDSSQDSNSDPEVYLDDF